MYGLIYRDTAFVVSAVNSTVANWVTRVIANGGARPTEYTQAAMSAFMSKLDGNGLTPFMKTLCVFVPDSLIAASTPIIKGTGFDPWTRVAYLSTDLDNTGIKGDGTSKYFNTGVVPSDLFTVNGGGITMYNTSSSGGAENEAGCAAATAGVASFLFSVSNMGTTFFDIFDQSTTRINVANVFWEGYMSINRTSTTNFIAYRASPTVTHMPFASSGATAVTSPPSLSAFVGAWNVNGSAASFSRKRLFMAAFHDGMTEAQSLLFYTAVQELKEAYNVTPTPNPVVTSWNSRVLTNGGPAPTGNTITTLNRFCNTLDTQGIMPKIISMNVFAADSLTACITPLVNIGGNDPWINHAFTAADLNLSGLKGDGSSKYLDTGIKGNSGLSASTGGLTIYTNTASAGGENDMGCNNSNDPSFALIIDFAGNSYNDIYDQSSTRIGPVANGGFKGYHSNNRISTTDFKVYQANGTTAHNTIGSSAGTNTRLPANLTFPVFVFCWNATGSPNSFSSKRVCFAAVHQGLTATESQIFYDAIQQMRIELGGGHI